MNGKARILIVDDDPQICALVQDYLTSEGYEVLVALNGSDMRRAIEGAAVDLVLLDVVLPEEDGLTLIRWLRTAAYEVRVIMLTGRSDPIDRIIGLEMGADDYLPKPFHLRELLARVKSVSRRTAEAAAEPSAAVSPQVCFAGWHLSLFTRELLSPPGEAVRLTSGEFDLLKAFVTHPNQPLSRERLLDLTRGRETGPFDRTIDVQVGRLRRKLGDNPQQPRLIKTVRNSGYIFAAPVEPALGRAAGLPVPRPAPERPAASRGAAVRDIAAETPRS